MKCAVLISAVIEWAAVKDILSPAQIYSTPYGEAFTIELGGKQFRFIHSGWGKISSAGTIQFVIDHLEPELIINLGTCGGFDGYVSLDETILVEKTFVYDIVELMGDYNSVFDFYASDIDLNWLPEPFPHPVKRGMIASADGDLLPEKIPWLIEQGAVAADWESAALAWVAKKNDARLLILRTVSDLVSVSGGEAYDNIALFKERTNVIMRRMLPQLPDWVRLIEEQHL